MLMKRNLVCRGDLPWFPGAPGWQCLRLFFLVLILLENALIFPMVRSQQMVSTPIAELNREIVKEDGWNEFDFIIQTRD